MKTDRQMEKRPKHNQLETEIVTVKKCWLSFCSALHITQIILSGVYKMRRGNVFGTILILIVLL